MQTKRSHVRRFFVWCIVYGVAAEKKQRHFSTLVCRFVNKKNRAKKTVKTQLKSIKVSKSIKTGDGT